MERHRRVDTGKTPVRISCIRCTAKHAFAAEILLRESRTGYAINRARAVAELEQASQESEAEWPTISAALLAERKNLENPAYEPDLEDILEQIWDAYADSMKDGEEDAAS